MKSKNLEDPNNTKISRLDRLLGAFGAVFVITLTYLVITFIVLMISSGGHGRGTYKPLELISPFFFKWVKTSPYWGGAIILLFATVGFSLGTRRTALLFGHLWFTERPRKIWLSIGLWLIIILQGYMAFKQFAE